MFFFLKVAIQTFLYKHQAFSRSYAHLIWKGFLRKHTEREFCIIYKNTLSNIGMFKYIKVHLYYTCVTYYFRTIESEENYPPVTVRVRTRVGKQFSSGAIVLELLLTVLQSVINLVTRSNVRVMFCLFSSMVTSILLTFRKLLSHCWWNLTRPQISYARERKLISSI